MAQDRKGIVVGVDGSPGAQTALDWAAARTGEFGPVRPVYVWEYPIVAWAPGAFSMGVTPPRAEMQQAAEEAAAKCVASLDGVDHAEVVVREGDPGVVLLDEAASADLLVVSTRSRGPVRSNVLGSVGRHCADHTTVPMVVVPPHDPDDPPATHNRVVVGVDASDGAAAALGWAITHAPDDAEITAINTWQTPFEGLVIDSPRFDTRLLRAAALETVTEMADKVCAELGVDPDRVTREITEGDPRWVLLSKEDVADLLVLGQRGRTGLPHFLLGSTTTALIHRPHCPIAVVPH